MELNWREAEEIDLDTLEAAAEIYDREAGKMTASGAEARYGNTIKIRRRAPLDMGKLIERERDMAATLEVCANVLRSVHSGRLRPDADYVRQTAELAEADIWSGEYPVDEAKPEAPG